MALVVVEKLTKAHDRKAFDCGDDGYNGLLQRSALQHARQNASVTWVAVEEGGSRILGYVTLSMGRVEFEHVDEAIVKALPKHPIPVLHVGKLAVDREFQGKRIGPRLLRFAGEQAVMASKNVGCHAVELTADDEGLVAYYQAHGFLSMKAGTLRLYQTVASIEKAMAEAARRATIGP